MYRDSEVFERRFFPTRAVEYPFALLFGWMMIASVPVDPSITWAAFAAFVVLLFVVAYLDYRTFNDRTCGEIVLSDDGACVLKTVRRAIRLDVSEIRSVRYSYDGSEQTESCTIHYQGGKLDVSPNMPGLLDFLKRLNRLNPWVDLTSFPRSFS
jgi:hypothetical protein